MLQKFLKVTTAGAFAVLAIALAQSSAVRAQEKDKKLTTKQIMGTGHKGADSLFAKVQTAVKAKKWDDASGPAKELAENGSMFPKATPPRDDKKNWEEMAGKYADNTKALAEAVNKKDEAAAGKALMAIGGSCKACHDDHKGKK
jgi:cytochrome c556